MRRYYVPLAVLGFAGLGALVLSQRRRQALRWVGQNFNKAPDALLQWNETTQRELEHLRTAIDRLADSLGTAG